MAARLCCDSKTAGYINDQLIKILDEDEYKTLINNGQYDEVYEKLSLDKEILGITVSSSTLLFEENEIKVLEYLHNIPDYFLVNTDIQEFTIPNGYKTIGKEAFKNCRDLVTLLIPKTLAEIKAGAFANCVNLKVIYYQGTRAEFNKIVVRDDNAAFKAAKVQCLQ